MYNVNTGMVPVCIQDLIPPIVSEISDYSLRNNSNISVPLNRTCILQKSFISSAIIGYVILLIITLKYISIADF